MADASNTLNDDDFFGDIVDTPKEGIEQNRKQECLKGVINKRKAYLLVSRWTQEKVDEASNETKQNKAYALYRQREVNEKF